MPKFQIIRRKEEYLTLTAKDMAAAKRLAVTLPEDAWIDDDGWSIQEAEEIQ